MKIPRYIEESLQIRANSAARALHHDYVVSEFCEKNGIQVDDSDVFGGCEVYVDPYASSERVRQAILDHVENS